MRLSSTTAKIMLLFGAVFFVFAFAWNKDRQKNENKISTLETTISQQKQEKNELTGEIDRLTKEYDSLYKEKNGLANDRLLIATNKLFSAVSEYDTSKEQDSILERKNRAAEVADATALEGIFPKDADKGAATVTTISKLEKTPEVYLLSSDDKEVRALVWTDYSISIADSEKQKGTNLYKVTFNQLTQKFVSIENLGSVKTP